MEEPLEGPLAGLLERFRATGEPLVEAGDTKRHFHGMYHRTTMAVDEGLRRGRFEDPEWVARWDTTFAGLYLDALEAWQRGEDPPAPWRVAFEAAADPTVMPLRHQLLGMNAHINYDLPQALIAVIDDDEFHDAELLACRHADFGCIDEIIVGRVPAEYRELRRAEEPGMRTVIDRLLYPVNTAATRRFLPESRRKVWHNAGVLSRARRHGHTELAGRVRELEALSGAKVAELLEPGQVLLKLAVRGFGVVLSGDPSPADPPPGDAGAGDAEPAS